MGAKIFYKLLKSKERYTRFLLILLIVTSYFNLFSDSRTFADKLELTRTWAVDVSGQITAFELGDLDGDGIEEIFVGNFSDSGYIDVFDAVGQIQIGHSPGTIGKVTAIAVGDIDDDDIAEIVAGTDSAYLYIFNSDDFSLQWVSDTFKVLEEPIDTSLTMLNLQISSVAVSDVDKDDTLEVYVGTYRRNYRQNESPHSLFNIEKGGSLFRMDPITYDFTRISPDPIFSKLEVDDINEDNYEDLICGASGYIYYFEMLGSLHSEGFSVDLYQNGSLDYIYHFNSLFAGAHELDSFSVFNSLTTGNCDLDEQKEIVASFMYHITYMSYELYDPIRLLVFDSDSLKPQLDLTDTVQSESERINGLAIHEVTDDSVNEILAARQKGIIEVLDGTTGDLIATSDTLPSILFFGFGDVCDSADICISDGDSFFVYNVGYVGVEEETESNLPEKFTLFQNYPNPFNPNTTIEYYIPKDIKVTVSIHNILGQKVKTLVDWHQKAGFRKVLWYGKNQNGEDVASGIYFYQLKTEAVVQTKKMVLIK
ncbi:MAG: hypothetical protein AMJ90_00475 [candidate division Zixibacteria bacterium SM23_73_2]|nr:MAG: hypothetical protein AMJ90_00475 [candidate division Zixibacteria bacterium SM23_73_2]